VIVFGLSMHPEINTHNKIRANIFGFAVIPPLFSLMRYIAKKLLAKEKSLGISANKIIGIIAYFC
jgi:hypothetical protein